METAEAREYPETSGLAAGGAAGRPRAVTGSGASAGAEAASLVLLAAARVSGPATIPSECIDCSADNQDQYSDNGDHNCRDLEHSGHLLTSMAPVYGAAFGWASRFEPAGQATRCFLSFSKETLTQFQSLPGWHSVDWGCSREDTPRSRQEKPTCPDGLFSLSRFSQALGAKCGENAVPGRECDQSGPEKRGSARLLLGLEIASRVRRIPGINRTGQMSSLLAPSGEAPPSGGTVSSAAAGFLF